MLSNDDRTDNKNKKSKMLQFFLVCHWNGQRFDLKKKIVFAALKGILQ